MQSPSKIKVLTMTSAIVGMLFIVLRLANIITWSWWWVMSPFLVYIGILIILLIILFIICCAIAKYSMEPINDEV